MTITTATVAPLPAGALVARRTFAGTVTASTSQYVEDGAAGQAIRVLQGYFQTNGAGDVLLREGSGGTVRLRVPGNYPGVLLPFNPLGWCDIDAANLHIDVSAGSLLTRACMVLGRIGGESAFSALSQVIAPTPPGAALHRLEIDEATAAATPETLLAGVSGKTLRVVSGTLTAADGTTIDLGVTGSTNRRFISYPNSSGHSQLDLAPSPYGWAESNGAGVALSIQTSAATTVRGYLIVAEIDDAE